eukprot:TRINITY_DN15717_c0_g3_i1.p1 TRINITY_DN15717_c0_g3~~TRINITY_DN15717_c0_g3_i1.p1  ORF type:complete len:535 (-),score=79.61 TRINITY_DN15717_c0_g3_i1:220-1824(-)
MLGAAELARRAAEPEQEESKSKDDLFEVWSSLYNLSQDAPPPVIHPPSSWARNELCPLAPHLEDCALLHQHWTRQEARGKAGQDPAWLLQKGEGFEGSLPPWVEGTDEENLSKTRYMQAKIWARQFPPNCSDPSLRFALVPWVTSQGHGIGSQLHCMVQAMGSVLKSGRTLVPVPGSYQRGDHDGCQGDKKASFDCYWFPLVDPKCTERALKLWIDTPEAQRQSSVPGGEQQVCMSDAPVVFVDAAHEERFSSYVPKELARFWNVNPVSVEVFGHLLSKTDRQLPDDTRVLPKEVETRMLRASWWRAQAIRFILRRPSLYLCHHTNKARHTAFGRRVADQVGRIPDAMEFATSQTVGTAPYEENLLHSTHIGSSSLDLSAYWRTSPPYLPRPMVSIHVRQGDKGIEMRLFSLPSHMWLAERLRRRDPGLTNVWLSTEMQHVIDETRLYPNWTFFYTHFRRQGVQGMYMNQFEDTVGVAHLTMTSFVNLRLAAECDYFIGALGSNWPRLLNELRMTGGKLKNGFLAVNFDEFRRR